MKKDKENHQMSLGDILNTIKPSGELEVINECYELLVTFAYVSEPVCSLDKILSKEFLARKVLNIKVDPNVTSIRIEGVEDAD